MLTLHMGFAEALLRSDGQVVLVIGRPCVTPSETKQVTCLRLRDSPRVFGNHCSVGDRLFRHSAENDVSFKQRASRAGLRGKNSET